MPDHTFDRDTILAVSDALCEGTDLDVHGDPHARAVEILTYLHSNDYHVTYDHEAVPHV